MAPSPLVTAADYAQTLRTARRAKNWLVLLLLAVLAGQLGLFLAARYTDLFGATIATTRPSDLAADTLRYVVAVQDFLGIATVLVLAMVLMLVLQIMLVARLVGLSRLTSSLIWCLILIVLLFPWQSILSGSFKIPGVLYTWSELQSARFATDSTPLPRLIMAWARFAGFPGAALLILWIVQGQSRLGLRLALGETAPPPTVGRLG